MEARLQRIKRRLFKEYYQKKTWWGDDLSIFDDDPGLASRPLVVRKALAVQKVCREMPLEVKDDELVHSHPWSDFLDRVRLHGEAAKRAHDETGQRHLLPGCGPLSNGHRHHTVQGQLDGGAEPACIEPATASPGTEPQSLQATGVHHPEGT